jgi:hypothetical protein
MMRLIALSILFSCVLLPVTVMACDLEPWRGKKQPKPAEVVKEMLSRGAPEFFGKVKITGVLKRGEKDVVYRMKVLKQYAGSPQKEFQAYSSYKNSCVFVAEKGDERMILLPQRSTKPYNIHLYDAYFFYVSDDAMEAYLDTHKLAE